MEVGALGKAPAIAALSIVAALSAAAPAAAKRCSYDNEFFARDTAPRVTHLRAFNLDRGSCSVARTIAEKTQRHVDNKGRYPRRVHASGAMWSMGWFRCRYRHYANYSRTRCERRSRRAVFRLGPVPGPSPPATEAADELTWDQVVRRGDDACYNERTAIRVADARYRPYNPWEVHHRNWAKWWRHIRRAHKRTIARLNELRRRAEDFRLEHFDRYLRGRKRLYRMERGLIRAAYRGSWRIYRSREIAWMRTTSRNRPHGRRYGFEVCGRKRL